MKKILMPVMWFVLGAATSSLVTYLSDKPDELVISNEHYMKGVIVGAKHSKIADSKIIKDLIKQYRDDCDELVRQLENTFN